MDKKSPTGVGLGLRWAFIDEVASGDAPASIRFFEISPENYIRRGGYFPSALEAVAANYPLLTHGLMLGIGGEEALEPSYIRDLRSTLDSLGASRHSDHLCWSDADSRCLHDLLPLPIDRRILPALSDRIRRVQDLLGRPFSVENISYYGSPGWSKSESAIMGIAERDLLAELLEHADCKLLLDVNNVLVNAQNHGFDPYVYLEGLDLSRVIQLHVAGGERFGDRYDGLIIDTHGTSVPAEVEALMAWVIARTGPLPVIYERDNKIPALAKLGREVEHLQATYEKAVANYHQGTPPPTPPAAVVPRQMAPDRGLDDLGALQRSFARRILDLDLGLDLEKPADPSTETSSEAALRAMGLPRIAVYRTLVRGSIHGLLGNMLPRTLARIEDQRDNWIDRWLADAGPRSRILRELVDEWVAWVSPRWLADPEVPNYLVDLLRHEAIEMVVDAAPAANPPADMSEAFALESRLLFDPSARLEHYEHAIHLLPEDCDDRSPALAQATALLIYRDDEHEVRFLHLSPLAAAITELLLSGETVKQALIAGSSAVGLALDDAVLGRMSGLFADFANRRILLGSVDRPL